MAFLAARLFLLKIYCNVEHLKYLLAVNLNNQFLENWHIYYPPLPFHLKSYVPYYQTSHSTDY